MKGGEIFVTKMRALGITDLADAMAEVLGKIPKDIVKMGLRPGEKLYEELITAEEMPRTMDLERLLVVLPADENISSIGELRAEYAKAPRVTKDWHSGNDEKMSKADIVEYLRQHRILDKFVRPGGIIPDRDSFAE